MPVYPITFSINQRKILDEIPLKQKILAHIVPGELSTYIYDCEADYYQDMRSSFFAITKKKGGWDCLRHYEILANGCIPLFENLEQIPATIMTHFPKEVVLEANKLYPKIKKEGPLSEYTDACYRYIGKLLKWTKEKLSNDSMARYILNQTGHEGVKKILFLSGKTSPDYLRCLTLCGFKELFQERCHDSPRIPHLYSDFRHPQRIYGKGMTYTRLIDSSCYDKANEKTIKRDIIAHSYDIVIYGSLHRGLPYLDLVNQAYKDEEVIFLCGEDEHVCDYRSLGVRPNNHLFVRELTSASLPVQD
jgi:hypothetical protein